MSSTRHSGRPREPRWAGLDDADLLAFRFRDLKLRLAGTPVSDDVADLYRALQRRGIRFRPHVWLSTEWFSPDGIPGIAIPFYLAHPRLVRLERRMQGEAEGGSRANRRRILRHEAGHALDTAFGLRRRADWRSVFGPASRPYPHCYSARPASRRYVQHLSHWYAQSHPTEDFAETFAVWLQPKARWRRDYAGWRALQKLEFVDRLMHEIAGRRATGVDRSRPADVGDNHRRLGEHYRRSHAADSRSERRYDAWLQQVFAPAAGRPGALGAARFLSMIEPELRRALVRRPDAGSYLAQHVTGLLRSRSRKLGLVLACGRREAKRRAIQLHERVTADLLRRNRECYIL